MVFARFLFQGQTIYLRVHTHCNLSTVLLQFSFPLKDQNGGCTVYLSVSSFPKVKIKDKDSQRETEN